MDRFIVKHPRFDMFLVSRSEVDDSVKWVHAAHEATVFTEAEARQISHHSVWEVLPAPELEQLELNVDALELERPELACPNCTTEHPCLEHYVAAGYTAESYEKSLAEHATPLALDPPDAWEIAATEAVETAPLEHATPIELEQDEPTQP